jgi:Zn ribbon nucleic-acid-binding protein
MIIDYQIQTEEFYVARFVPGTPMIGTEQRICDCGGELDTINILFEDGVSFKICTKCGKEHYINVSF